MVNCSSGIASSFLLGHGDSRFGRTGRVLKLSTTHRPIQLLCSNSLPGDAPYATHGNSKANAGDVFVCSCSWRFYMCDDVQGFSGPIGISKGLAGSIRTQTSEIFFLLLAQN